MPGRKSVHLALGALLLAACGCWLSPAEPPIPDSGLQARTIVLSTPDSTLANIREAFRVGSISTYMRSFADSLDPSNPERFTALFDFNDRATLPPNPNVPTDPITRLLNGEWHTEQERNSMTSAMNGITTSDTTRFSYILNSPPINSGIEASYSITYTLNVNQGNLVTYQGAAQLEFRLNSAGNWVLLKWEDQRLNQSNPPPTWGKLRYINRS